MLYRLSRGVYILNNGVIHQEVFTILNNGVVHQKVFTSLNNGCVVSLIFTILDKGSVGRVSCVVVHVYCCEHLFNVVNTSLEYHVSLFIRRCSQH